ncbi:dnaJ-like protein 60, partial [Drosophila subobscura]|uniref:dnaJ-like protein 60 n=1 Tax=Drosophila subobscura TaxID=7241 RepID=UPI00155A608D
MTDYQDHYNVLGVKYNATLQQIKKAFRQMALRFHPDKNKNGEEKFKIIVRAYKVLIDPRKRYEFDQIYKSKMKNQKNSQQNNTFHQWGTWNKPPKPKPKRRQSHDDGFRPNPSYSHNTFNRKPGTPKRKMAVIILGSMVIAYFTYKMIKTRTAARAAEMVLVTISAEKVEAPLAAGEASLSSATSAVAGATAGGVSKISKWVAGSPSADSSATSSVASAASAVAGATAGGISNVWKWVAGSPSADSSATSPV